MASSSSGSSSSNAAASAEGTSSAAAWKALTPGLHPKLYVDYNLLPPVLANELQFQMHYSCEAKNAGKIQMSFPGWVGLGQMFLDMIAKLAGDTAFEHIRGRGRKKNKKNNDWAN